MSTMHSGGSRHRPPPKTSNTYRYLIACILLVFAFAFFYKSDDSFKSRIQNAAKRIENTVKEDLVSSRSRLLHQIEAWNARALLQGLHSQQIHIGNQHAGGVAVVAEAGGSSSSSSSAVSAKTASTAAAAASSSTSSSQQCACEKGPADAKWPMRTAAAVAAETPELAAALKKSAKNNEVMLALGRGAAGEARYWGSWEAGRGDSGCSHHVY